jgi:catechol O-methyltransferase
MKVGFLDSAIDTALENRRVSSAPEPDAAGLVCLEIGSYCGYSAVKIASRLRSGIDILYCIECDPKCVRWTSQLVEFAGLSDRVRVIQGVISSDLLRNVSDSIQGIFPNMQGPPRIDVLFVDHDKKMYYSDLKIVEASGLLQSGSVVVADNVLSFGTPKQDYLDHVYSSGLYRSNTLHKCFIEYAIPEDYDEETVSKAPADTYKDTLDGIIISIFK